MANPKERPGVKTTEFWLTLLAALVSGVLALELPKESVIMKAACVLGVALPILGYSVSRGMVKRSMVLLVVLLLPGLLGGCTTGMVRADAIEGLVQKVCDRHDRLLKGELDPKALGEDDRATYLRSTELLRKTVAAAKSP